MGGVRSWTSNSLVVTPPPCDPKRYGPPRSAGDDYRQYNCPVHPNDYSSISGDDAASRH